MSSESSKTNIKELFKDTPNYKAWIEITKSKELVGCIISETKEFSKFREICGHSVKAFSKSRCTYISTQVDGLRCCAEQGHQTFYKGIVQQEDYHYFDLEEISI